MTVTRCPPALHTAVGMFIIEVLLLFGEAYDLIFQNNSNKLWAEVDLSEKGD